MSSKCELVWPEVVRSQMSPFLTSEQKLGSIQHLREVKNWRAVLRFLQFQRLTGVAHAALAVPEAVDSIPKPVQGFLRRTWMRYGVQAAQRMQTVRQILDAARNDGVDILIVKGPVFVEEFYSGDYGARPFGDVDMVVRPSQVEKLVALLRDLFEDSVRIRYEHATSRVHAHIGRTILEIHWDLSLFYAFSRLPRRARRQESLWERSEAVDYGWGPCRRMALEDMLVHMAEHAVLQHDLNINPGLLLTDFSRGLQRVEPEFATDLLIRRSQEHGYPMALMALCVAAAEAFEGAAEHPLIAYAQMRFGRLLQTRVVRQLNASTGPHHMESIRDFADMTQAMALFMDGFDSRVRFLRQLILPTRYALSETFGKNLSRPQYLVRLFVHFACLPFFLKSMWILFTRQVQDVSRAMTHFRRTQGRRF